MAAREIPDWVTFPEDDWITITPEEAGLDAGRLDAFLAGLDVKGADFGGEDHTGNRWGSVITRGGYLLHSWGDRHYRFQTASTGKTFSWVLLAFAIEDGLIDPDEPIHKTWTGEGQLSHPHKHLDQGHHKTLTWRHMIGFKFGRVHFGGFPFELGIRWRERRTGLEDADAVPGVPEWTNWTGDPFYDLYSHTEPGTVGLYSSAGFWRLGQALTAAWNRDLKDVLDERLFSRIGIPTDRWDWYTGGWVKDQEYFYPDIPDTYTYLDPPYEINGHVVRSGPGWVVISASDLARFGHLLATRGNWKGEQIIDPQWLRGHGGGNKSGVTGESEHYTAMALVTTQGLDHVHSTVRESFLPQEVFVGPVKATKAP
jgi:CubicO group peptidase (beta-lactamase class C family)